MLDIWTLQMQFSIAVMVVLILRQFMKKLPKIYSYLLWIFVFVRLLCPFSFELEHAIMPKAEVITEVDYMNQTSQRSFKINGETIVATSEKSGETLGDDLGQENKFHVSKNQIVKSIWFLGTMLLLAYNFSTLLTLLEKIKSAEHLENNVYAMEGIGTPFTIGIVKPRIYIPNLLEMEEREYIICHEKIHIKRKDYLIKNIAFFLTAVYWFNPLCWAAFRYLELDMEMSCDEAVVRQMGNDIKKPYSQSLLNFAAGKKNRAFTPLTFGEVGVKERIKNVLKKKNVRKWMAVLGIFIVIFVGIFVFTTKKTQPELTVSKKEAAAFVESWAEAFVARNTEYILQHADERTKGEYETERLLLDNEDGTYDFGWSSPWPWGMELYEISEIVGNQATIYYTALTSEPHITVWRDIITFRKQPDGEYLVTESKFEAYEQIHSLDKFLKAYPNGAINGTSVDYLTNELGKVLNRNAKENPEIEEYQKLFSVETAARYLLNLSEDEDRVRISITDGKITEMECTVRVIFAEDESSIDVKMIQPYGSDGIWIPQTAEKRSSEYDGENLTLEMFLEIVGNNSIEKTDWRNFQNATTDLQNEYSLNYYVNFYFEYEGQKMELAVSADKEEEGTICGIWLNKTDDSSLWIYDGDADDYRCTQEEILDFIRKDHNILNEVSFELPKELTVDDYSANVGFEGGCLFLPMAYEENDSTENCWKSSGMVSRYSQDYLLVWSDNQIVDVANHYNHTSKEVVETVDDLCAPALLLHFQHDLYTAADLASAQEQGINIDSRENTSDYWYLFIAEPGQEYGYVITLTQKNYTKEDILNVGKSFEILK